MSDVIEKLNEGDVFRWNYRDPKTNGAPFGDYHCCSCIGVVYDDRLFDTYWLTGMRSQGGGRVFGTKDLPKLELTRLGNMADLEKAREYQADYYDDADIVNLNHANSTSGNFYLRKGAVRSPDKMMAIARQRLAEAESDFHTARRRMAEIGKLIDAIESGATDLYIPSWRR